MKTNLPLFRNGVLQREANILFTEPGGPFKTTVIYEAGDPRKKRIGKIRKISGQHLLTIDAVWIRSEGIVKGLKSNCKAFKKLQDAKDFAIEVFSEVGKNWMEKQA
jgi:hypothetical protein|tara:strand:- start:1596 stop:1913 length:318 start_codon:yes stop_codon:yes gene_type:complete